MKKTDEKKFVHMNRFCMNTENQFNDSFTGLSNPNL